MADKWIDDRLRLNKVAYDQRGKEYVLITNGVCHQCTACVEHQDCVFTPHEAIVLRVIGRNDNGPIIGWTCRSVNFDDLAPSDMTKEEFMGWADSSEHVGK